MDAQGKVINKLTPAIAIPPGEYLKDILDKKDLKQREFAITIGMAHSQLNEIIKGKRGISTELAIILEAALGIDKDYWINLQSNYELAKANLDKNLQKKVSIIRKWVDLKQYVALNYFKKLKKLSNILEKDIDFLFTIYGVKSANEIKMELESATYKNFKKSPVLKVNPVNLLGWVKYVEYKASKLKKIEAFNRESESELIEKLKSVFLGESIVDNLEKILPKYGIKLIIEPRADQVPVDGIAFWSKDNPAIGLTLRHKRLDNLAFTLFHELGHIYRHLEPNKNNEIPFIDDIAGNKGNQASKEKEANIFAENHLIPKKKWKKFIEKTEEFSSETIISFANEINIHPAIPLGRLKHEYNEFYKKRFSISNSIN